MHAADNADRARVYRFLARVFRPPDAATLGDLRREDIGTVGVALQRLRAPQPQLERAAQLCSQFAQRDEASLTEEWNRNFEPAGELVCSPNETSHTAKTPQEAWLKTYRLADIAGFYRAFGAEIEQGSERSEKADHIGIELEFMHLLAVKWAMAQEREQIEHAEICREATAAFLADHLGRWCADLAETLREGNATTTYLLAAELLRDFVALDTDRVGPARTSRDLGPAHHAAKA
jgi:DMSO reductase family type II enzyme chaperone